MPRKMRKEEIDKKIDEATQILREIANNRQIPRNIRRAAEDAISVLHNEELTPAVRAANSISIMENMAYDPNMPVFARMWVWKAVSILEPIRD
jgi:hypothetical protein